VEQTKVTKKTGSNYLDEAGFELSLEDEKMAQNAIQVGVIISVGKTAWECFGPDFTGKPWANVGDTVFFPRYSGASVPDPEEGKDRNFVLLADTDIQIVIRPGDNPEFELPPYTLTNKRES
jgi:co-chaperonin GroES (HSP10)